MSDQTEDRYYSSTVKSVKDSAHRTTSVKKKVVKRTAEAQKLYRERLKRVAHLPNLVRRKKLREVAIKHSPEYKADKKRRDIETRKNRRKLKSAMRQAVGRNAKTGERRKRGSTRVMNAGDFKDGVFDTGVPLEMLAKSGMSNEDIAAFLGVTIGVFRGWMKRSSLLRNSLLKGREIANSNVAQSLYRQAVGYTIPEEKIFYNTKTGKVKRVKTTKYYPPTPVANFFWLKNKDPDNWKDKREIENTGGVSGNNLSEIKFTLVQVTENKKSGKEQENIIDADYKILPGGGTNNPSSSTEIVPVENKKSTK